MPPKKKYADYIERVRRFYYHDTSQQRLCAVIVPRWTDLDMEAYLERIDELCDQDRQARKQNPRGWMRVAPHQYGGVPIFDESWLPDWPTCGECKGPLSLLYQFDLYEMQRLIARDAESSVMQCFYCINEECSEDIRPSKAAVRFIDPTQVRNQIRIPPGELVWFENLELTHQTDRKSYSEIWDEEAYHHPDEGDIPHDCFDELSKMTERENLCVPKVGGFASYGQPAWTCGACDSTDPLECVLQFGPPGGDMWHTRMVVVRCAACRDLGIRCECD